MRAHPSTDGLFPVKSEIMKEKDSGCDFVKQRVVSRKMMNT